MTQQEGSAAAEAFRRAHGTLDDSLMASIEALTEAAASLKVFGESDRGALKDAIRHSAEAVGALHEALNAVATGLGSGDAEALLETVRELEPPVSERPAVGAARAQPEDIGGVSGGGREGERANAPFEERPAGGPPAEAAGDLRETTATSKLMAPYGIAVNLESDLYRDRIPRPYLLRRFKTLWSEIRFLRDRRAGTGLVERVQSLSTKVTNAVEGIEGDDEARPWHVDDRDRLGELERAFRELYELDDEEIAGRHRDDWLERVERWLETAESESEAVAHMTEMLTRFATDVPRVQDANVQTAVQRMMALEGVPDEIVDRLKDSSQ